MKHVLIFILLVSVLPLKICFSQDVNINSLSINTNNDDFAPTFYQKGIVITSNRKNSLTENFLESNTSGELKNLNNLFYFSKIDSSKFNQEEDLSILNHSNKHEGPCTFSKNFDTIYFAGTDYKKGHLSKQKIKLFFSVKQENGWSVPEELNLFSSNVNLSHPNLSQKGNILFFVSDMPNGFGGMDIWFCTKNQDNSWSKPINAGKNVNTANDEVFPFLSQRGVLYFASNRSESLGGFDIFQITFQSSDTPKKIASPINSIYDDYALITNDEGKTGYFSSNRKPNKGDDIYYFEIQTDFNECIRSYEPKFCYSFYDTEAHKNEPHLRYVWNFGDGEISHAKTPYHCFSNSGQKKLLWG